MFSSSFMRRRSAKCSPSSTSPSARPLDPLVQNILLPVNLAMGTPRLHERPLEGHVGGHEPADLLRVLVRRFASGNLDLMCILNDLGSLDHRFEWTSMSLESVDQRERRGEAESGRLRRTSHRRQPPSCLSHLGRSEVWQRGIAWRHEEGMSERARRRTGSSRADSVAGATRRRGARACEGETRSRRRTRSRHPCRSSRWTSASREASSCGGRGACGAPVRIGGRRVRGGGE